MPVLGFKSEATPLGIVHYITTIPINIPMVR
jgi:hypothetical protein